MSNEELNLLNEMKENCLKKGQYIDEKAKDKFNMLCHCEDFIIENYEQSKEIERLNNIINKIIEFLQREQIKKGEYCDFLIENKQIKVQEVLDKIKELKGIDK